MPEFLGGEGAFYRYLVKEFHIDVEKENIVEGDKGFVGFVINENGDVEDVKILRSFSWLFDEEVMRVIKSMPRWKPGKSNGINVSVSFSMPFSFTGNGE